MTMRVDLPEETIAGVLAKAFGNRSFLIGLFITLLVVVTSIVLRPSLDSAGAAVRVLFGWRWSLVTLWFTAVFLLIMVRFWDYWSTLL